MGDQSALLTETIDLLRAMVRIPSISRQEKDVADFLEQKLSLWFPDCVKRINHNLIVTLDSGKPGPTLLMCSHIDTVAVAAGWTRDPFGAEQVDGRIYGLGANDAGASVVSMIAAARHMGKPTNGRLVLGFVAEEEAGDQGFYSIEKALPRYDNAVFGEPTDMGVASAMRGSMKAVMRSHGRACHASRPWEGDNACDHFVTDLLKLRSLDLQDGSRWKCATIEPTIIRGGESINQIPALVETTLDIRTTPEKNNDWVAENLQQLGLDIEITMNRRRPMQNPPQSRIMQAVARLSPPAPDQTFNGTCDMAFASAPSIVMGPGKSDRSHAADEFIETTEITAAITIYRQLLESYFSSAA